MNVNNSHWQSSQALFLQGTERWQVYQRLQELDIICSCGTNQPLQVNLQSPTDLVLLWSVARCITSSRSELLSWLERCWVSTTANNIQ
jgi:hypothetical protein